MYRALLVNRTIADGWKLIEHLRRERFPVSAAFWYHDGEAIRWRLVIVSPRVDRGGIAAYAVVQRALTTIQRSTLTLDEISVISPHSSDFADFSRWLQGAHDAYVYQL